MDRLFDPEDFAAQEEQFGHSVPAKEWHKQPDAFVGVCYKQCYELVLLRKGALEEYGVRGVYICSDCGYVYPPFCAPEAILAPPDEDPDSIMAEERRQCIVRLLAQAQANNASRLS